jgi:flagellar motor switch protein FliM
MLVLSLQCTMGEVQGVILLATPYPALEPLIRQLTGEAAIAGAVATPQSQAPAQAAVKWNAALDEVAIPISAQCPGFELSARQILHLKPGDVLPINPEFTNAVVVRLADTPKFKGRLGAIGECWAVELTHLIKT